MARRAAGAFAVGVMMFLLADPGGAQPYRTGLGGGNLGGGGRGFGGGGRGNSTGPIKRLEGGVTVNEDTVRTAREIEGHSVDLPTWAVSPAFKADVFTYARIIFPSVRNSGTDGLGWWIDFPDADINISNRLQYITSLKVDPDARVLKLTDPELTSYPVIMMEHVEGMRLPQDQTLILRRYLRAGGALMVNDFWGTAAWNNLASEMKRVLPDRNWVDLPLSHPLFHCIFELKGPMPNLQVPTIQFWNRDYDPGNPASRVSVPRNFGWEDMHVRAWLDDKQRIMVLAFHNTDMPDGWEREGENPDYFKQFAEKRSYPLFINALYYLMTH